MNQVSPDPPAPGRGMRLWVKLALLAAAGVVATHALHLVLGARLAERSVVEQLGSLGGGIARLVANEAADPILTQDNVTLAALVDRTVTTRGVAYCFVVRDGAVLATSFRGGTPAGLVLLRSGGASGPVVIVDGDERYLDVEEPVPGGRAGAVRVGLKLDVVKATRRAIAAPLGLLALALTVVGLAGAVILARSIARPIDELVATADRFRPEAPVEAVTPRGGREMATLAARFNQMMRRLRAGYEEQERLRAQALAAARLATLGSVVAGVAHEVNNPLASLKAGIELLREGSDPVQRDEDLGTMQLAIDRIRDLVRRLLDLANPRPVALTPTSLVELARDAPRVAALSLRGKGVELAEVVEPGAQGTTVLADRKQIAQAVLNLLLNAAYVTPQGGQIRVRVRAAGARRGISIEDDGPGIPQELRHRVLQPFFTTKPGGEGTGLGLSLTRTIVDQHHGSLEFEFPERGGTVVTIWLAPAPTPDAEAACVAVPATFDAQQRPAGSSR